LEPSYCHQLCLLYPWLLKIGLALLCDLNIQSCAFIWHLQLKHLIRDVRCEHGEKQTFP
jgi:hypothetical protein